MHGPVASTDSKEVTTSAVSGMQRWASLHWNAGGLKDRHPLEDGILDQGNESWWKGEMVR